MTNKKQLQSLMTKHNLDRFDVADLLNCRKNTVDTWLVTQSRPMPDNMIELLTLKLK